MKKIVTALCVAVGLLVSNLNTYAADASAIKDIKIDQDTYMVMTFNLAVSKTDNPLWLKRKPEIRKIFEDFSPDIIGTQEGTYGQLRDLVGDDDASPYKWIGVGREGGSRGEYMAIFYKKDRFIPLEYDHLWLSENPREIGSKSWDTACTRLVTWGRFLDKKTNRQFYVCNTHLDHISQEARVNGCKVVCKEIAKFKKDLPVFVTGDFNRPSTEKDIHGVFIDAGLQDTWDDKDQLRINEEYNSFNDFKKASEMKGGVHIDWIFTRPNVDVLGTAICVYPEESVNASDHYPVVSVVKLPPQK